MQKNIFYGGTKKIFVQKIFMTLYMYNKGVLCKKTLLEKPELF